MKAPGRSWWAVIFAHQFGWVPLHMTAHCVLRLCLVNHVEKICVCTSTWGFVLLQCWGEKMQSERNQKDFATREIRVLGGGVWKTKFSSSGRGWVAGSTFSVELNPSKRKIFGRGDPSPSLQNSPSEKRYAKKRYLWFSSFDVIFCSGVFLTWFHSRILRIYTYVQNPHICSYEHIKFIHMLSKRWPENVTCGAVIVASLFSRTSYPNHHALQQT